MRTADDSLFISHLIFQCGGNAVRNNILYLAVQFLMNEMLLLCRIDHSLCHGMREMLFQTCCDAQKLITCHIVKGNHIDHSRLCLGQSTGLIKDDRVGLCHSLQILAALHRNVVHIGLADRGQHRDRHSQLQGTGEIYHQDRKCLGCVSGDQPGQAGAKQAVRNQCICKMLCLTLQGRFQFFRFLDHGHDLIKLAGASGLFDTDGDLSLFHYSTCINRGTLRFFSRNGLTG